MRNMLEWVMPIVLMGVYWYEVDSKLVDKFSLTNYTQSTAFYPFLLWGFL